MNLMLNMKDINNKQDISKDTLQIQKKVKKNPHFCENMSPCHDFIHFSLMFSEGEVKSPYFLQVWWALAPFIFISYCCLCQCQAVCYYYMPVPTKYHWNISFQKKCSSNYVVKNARNVKQFVWQPFSIEFQGFVKKKELNIYTRILDIMKL
jgi:hypothetical protein